MTPLIPKRRKLKASYFHCSALSASWSLFKLANQSFALCHVTKKRTNENWAFLQKMMLASHFLIRWLKLFQFQRTKPDKLISQKKYLTHFFQFNLILPQNTLLKGEKILLWNLMINSIPKSYCQKKSPNISWNNFLSKKRLYFDGFPDPNGQKTKSFRNNTKLPLTFRVNSLFAWIASLQPFCLGTKNTSSIMQRK